MHTKDFEAAFQDDLQDPEFVREYLSASLADAYASDDPGLVQAAILEVLQANRAVSRIARAAGLSRPALYRALAPTGNPEFATIFTLLPFLGVRLSVEAHAIETDGRDAQASE